MMTFDDMGGGGAKAKSDIMTGWFGGRDGMRLNKPFMATFLYSFMFISLTHAHYKQLSMGLI